MWGYGQVEASGMGGERIHLRQNKVDYLLNTPQGTSGKDSKGKAICNKVVGFVLFLKGKMRRSGDIWTFPFFW